MKSRKGSDGRSPAHCEGQTGPPAHPSPEVASQVEAPAPTVDSVPAAAALLPTELAEQRNAYLRLAADFDNFKKRTRRDSEQQAAAEKEAFISDLLPVLDNLDRALASVKSASSDPLHQGVERTLKQLGQMLQRHGIEAVDDVGRPFDPHRHEAVSVRHDPRQPDQSVLEVLQRGYCRGGQVFRPAQVVVNDLSPSSGARYAG
jgi:molecular chaperone GrpE